MPSHDHILKQTQIISLSSVNKSQWLPTALKIKSKLLVLPLHHLRSSSTDHGLLSLSHAPPFSLAVATLVFFQFFKHLKLFPACSFLYLLFPLPRILIRKLFSTSSNWFFWSLQVWFKFYLPSLAFSGHFIHKDIPIYPQLPHHTHFIPRTSSQSDMMWAVYWPAGLVSSCPIECNPMRAGPYLSSSSCYPQCLEHFLEYSRGPINNC